MEKIAKKIEELFVNRNEVYAEAFLNSSKMGYAKKEGLIDFNLIQEHLNGNMTIGVYQLKGTKLKWGCLDFDKNTKEDYENAQKIYSFAIEQGYNPLFEMSGGGEYKCHIWFFCKETEAKDMKFFLEDLCEKANVKPHEIFPKQSKADKSLPYGNLVKLPMAYHLSSKKWSYFLNDKFEPIASPLDIEELLEFHINNKDIIPKVIIKEKVSKEYSSPTIQTNPTQYDNFFNFVLKNELPSGISKEAVIGEKEAGINNNILKNLAIWLFKKGYTLDKLEEEIKPIYKEKGWSFGDLKGWFKKVEKGDISEISLGEITEWCESYYPDLLSKISKEINQDTIELEKINGYNDIPIVEESECEVQSLIFEGIERKSLNPLRIKKLYRIYKSRLGVGHGKIFIITSPNQNLNYGIQKLRLKQLSFDKLYKEYCNEKEFLLPNIFTKQEIKKYKIVKEGELERVLTHKEMFQRIFEKKKYIPFFLEKSQATTNANLVNAIKKFGFKKILNDFHNENGFIDKNFEYVLRIGMLNFSNECNPSINKYNDNKIIITNTKVGKSTQLAKQSELKFDSAKSSNLLGFSTAEWSNEGSLNKQYKLVVLDDFASANYEKDILDNLPSILENGVALIGKGKKSIKTECSSPIILTTNAQDIKEEKELILEFIKIINRLTETPQRIGSRFGCIIFSNKLRRAEQTEIKYTKRELEINKILLQQIFETISSFLERLLQERGIENFLERKNESYETAIQNYTEERNFSGELREFWKSTIAGYRHQRGFALKQGVIDFFLDNEEKLIEVINGTFNLTEKDIIEIKKLSEENLQRLNDLNLESLKNILQSQKSEEEYLQNRFDNLTKDYVKAIIKAVFKLVLEKPQEKENLIPFIMLNEYLDKESVYSNQARIVGVLPKDFTRINKDLAVFGMELISKGEEVLIQLHKVALENTFKIKLRGND